jgi:hypothetical protein
MGKAFDVNANGVLTVYDLPAEVVAAAAAENAAAVATRAKVVANEARIRELAIKCAKHAKTGTNAPTAREQSELLARLALAAAAEDQ